MMTTKTTTQTLLSIRETAANEIRNASPSMAGTEWMADRIRDIQYANAQLVASGWMPSDVNAAR